MFQVWICIGRPTRKYIEFGGRQAQNYVYPMVFLWSTGSLNPENYPIRLSAGGGVPAVLGGVSVVAT